MKSPGRYALAVTGFALALAAMPLAVNAAPRGLPTATAAYDSISITQPSKDQTIFDNAGSVEVRLSVSPQLRSADRVALLLDGREVAVRGALRFRLSGIARGEHTLEARILDGDGNVLIRSATVVFNVWQASRLFPNRSGK